MLCGANSVKNANINRSNLFFVHCQSHPIDPKIHKVSKALAPKHSQSQTLPSLLFNILLKIRKEKDFIKNHCKSVGFQKEI